MRATTLHEKIIDTEQYTVKSLQRVHDESESPVNASEQLEQNITSMTEKVAFNRVFTKFSKIEKIRPKSNFFFEKKKI